MRIFSIVALVLAFSLTACGAATAAQTGKLGPSTAASSTPVAATRIVATTGGRIALPDGGSLAFSQNSLDRDANVMVAVRPATSPTGMPSDVDVLAPLVDVSLGGAELRTMATVTLRFDRSRVDPATTVVYMAHRDDATGRWSNLAATVDYAAGTATAAVPHFSILGLFSTTVAKLAGAAAEIYEKLERLQGGAPEPRCGPAGDVWHLTVADPRLVAGCIEARPDGMALLRLYNRERYAQEINLSHLLAAGLTGRLAYPKEQASNAGDSWKDDIFRKMGEYVPAKTFLPAYGELTFTLQPGDPEHIVFTTQPSPFALAVDVFYQVLVSRGLLVGSKVTEVATSIVDTAQCASETAEGLGDRSFKRVILSLPVCIDKFSDKLFGASSKIKRSGELNSLLEVTKQMLEDTRVLRAAAELTIDGFRYGPNAQKVSIDRAVLLAPTAPTAVGPTVTATPPVKPAQTASPGSGVIGYDQSGYCRAVIPEGFSANWQDGRGGIIVLSMYPNIDFSTFVQQATANRGGSPPYRVEQKSNLYIAYVAGTPSSPDTSYGLVAVPGRSGSSSKPGEQFSVVCTATVFFPRGQEATYQRVIEGLAETLQVVAATSSAPAPPTVTVPPRPANSPFARDTTGKCQVVIPGGFSPAPQTETWTDQTAYLAVHFDYQRDFDMMIKATQQMLTIPIRETRSANRYEADITITRADGRREDGRIAIIPYDSSLKTICWAVFFYPRGMDGVYRVAGERVAGSLEVVKP